MEEIESEQIEIPRGGPIYIPNMASHLTKVPDFETCLVRLLQELEAELCCDSSQLCEDDDLSVDELKVYTEEELVGLAMKEAFQDQNNAENSERPGEGESSSTFDSSIVSLSETSCKDVVPRKNSRTPKKRKVQDSYIAKVEQLAMIKLKQDEDKAAARLHSFNSSCKINECSIPSSDNSERMKSLRSTDSAKQVKSSDVQEHIAVLYPETLLCVEVYHNTKKMTKEVFYNDMRDPFAIDYSEPVFDWLRNSKDEALKKWECIINGELQQKQRVVLGSVSASHLPHFKAIDMHKARFCDLRFRLGAGYLYCHQGDCKHTIVIRDMRLIHPEDIHNRAAYPIVIFQIKQRVQKCNVCKIYRATKRIGICILRIWWIPTSKPVAMQVLSPPSCHVRIMVIPSFNTASPATDNGIGGPCISFHALINCFPFIAYIHNDFPCSDAFIYPALNIAIFNKSMFGVTQVQ
ncbi:hypothetical protein Dsin_012693 [Dipteronia sinensis]|uniref:snRNA-activating protein complex subunit n=1 Tax=Dipteronia sinensis TaxID=43782 RepID=A0AAE0E866_9ROSI|nr:hypothetical protein Dsin_012693 [Dipteronia sinensis]